MFRETAHLLFTEMPWHGKTKRILVRSRYGKDIIGEVKWYPQWRRYTFFPGPATTFDMACLLEMVKYIGDLMDEREPGKGSKVIQEFAKANGLY